MKKQAKTSVPFTPVAVATTPPARATSCRPAAPRGFASGLTTNDFRKRTSVLRFTRNGLKEIASDVIFMANKEGLTGHARERRAARQRQRPRSPAQAEAREGARRGPCCEEINPKDEARNPKEGEPGHRASALPSFGFRASSFGFPVMTIRPNIRAMSGYVPGEQFNDPDIVKLNTNENPYPPSPRVFDAIRSALTSNSLRKYPQPLGDTSARPPGAC